MKIYLKDRIGEHCVRRIDEETHKDGASILEFIRNNWKKENEIVISLEGVKAITPSFIDEAFAKLVIYYDINELKKKLKFEGADEELKNRINQVVQNRLTQKVNGFFK